MNIVEAYMVHRGVPNRARNGSVLSVTFELLETMLELPSGVRLRHIVSDHNRNTLDFVLESNVPISGVTYSVEEGSQLQRISPDNLVRHQRLNEQRPVPPQYHDEATPPYIPDGYPFAPPGPTETDIEAMEAEHEPIAGPERPRPSLPRLANTSSPAEGRRSRPRF